MKSDKGKETRGDTKYIPQQMEKEQYLCLMLFSSRGYTF
jgi:hypothetical protein